MRTGLLLILLPIAIGIGFFACNQKNDNSGEKPAVDTSGKTHTSPQENIMNPYAGIDISPMDMAYYPPNYPQEKMGGSVTDPPLARIIYSRPHLQGRRLFHEVLKYGEPWRLGANEATELQLFKNATIQGRPVKAGRYVLYCIPQAKEWTIKLNENIDSWGLKPDTLRDIASFTIPVTRTNYRIEFFTIVFERKESGNNIVMAWDDLEARLPIAF